MKYLLLLVLATYALSAQAQAPLPKVTTTRDKAISDMVDDIRNEGWFKPDAITLDCIFRITPVGVKHAIDRYYELRSLFNTDDCQVDDILSTVAVKEDGTIDYEMLAITLQQESSELNRKCRVEDKKVQYISLLSGKKMISLLIRLKPQ